MLKQYMEINLADKKPDIRYLKDVRSVLYDQEWAKTASDALELYYMYRQLSVKNGLRYDITVIPPRMLGREFVKTKGHHHAGAYGELYVVLEGEGTYLMQKGDGNKIEDVCVVKAKAGQAVVIPGNYGHVTINSSKKELKMANWLVKEDKGNFSLFEKMQGACYYCTETGWIKNENYKEVPLLRFEEPLSAVPKDLNFLKG